jgi:hypothetical protein
VASFWGSFLTSSIQPYLLALFKLWLGGEIKNNFVFSGFSRLADSCPASRCLIRFNLSKNRVQKTLFLMVLQSVSTNLWCRKSAVVPRQEMKTGLSRLEPTATAPSVFVRHWRSSAKKAAGCIIRPVKPEDAAERDDAQSCGIVVGLVNAGFRRFSGNLAGLRQKRSNPGGMAVYSLGRSGRLFNVAEKCNRIQIRKRWTTCWTMPGTTPNIACAAPEAESDPPRQPCVRPAGRPLQPHQTRSVCRAEAQRRRPGHLNRFRPAPLATRCRQLTRRYATASCC